MKLGTDKNSLPNSPNKRGRDANRTRHRRDIGMLVIFLQPLFILSRASSSLFSPSWTEQGLEHVLSRPF